MPSMKTRLLSWQRSLPVALLAASAVTAVTAASATRAQTQSGSASGARATYLAQCAGCHGAAMSGGSAPALSGAKFRAKWQGKPPAALREVLAAMPLGNPKGISSAQRAQMLNYILAANRMTAGRTLTSAATAAAMTGAAAAPVAARTVKLPTAARIQSAPTTALPGDADLLDPAPGDWPLYNRDYRGQRFSPLAQITAANAGSLVPKCIFQLGEVGSFQASPIVFRGKMFVSTANGTYAIDAATCRKIWEHHHVPIGGEGLANSRGIALYQGMVLRGAPDGSVFALDAATGKPVWDLQASDGTGNAAISAAVLPFAGLAIVGNAGGDRGATGRIYAFDARTGQHRWTFNTVPTGAEFGAETWGGGQRLGGGGTWSTITADAATGQVLVPVGNPGADLDGRERPGANLFTDSVVAIDPKSGKRVWHVQQIAHDVHDWNTAAAPVLYSASGRDMMAVATKAGWLYLYDGKTRDLVARSETSTHLNDDVAPSDTPIRICPGTLGGSEWNGPGFDPQHGLLFVGTVERCGIYTRQKAGGTSTFGGTLQFDPPEAAYGWLRAFDAATGAQRWAWRADSPIVGGVSPTAGGVVMTGTTNGDFLVFSAQDGKVLYRFNTGGAIGGGVSVYAVDGQQRVAVTSGNSSRTIWGTTGAATVVVFGLPG